MKSIIVPFYSNTPDDTHCFQAALRMVLKYFDSDKDYTWEELDTITAKEKDLWTWPLAAMVWLQQHDFAIVDEELFDYSKFSSDPEHYLIEYYGEDVANEQLKHSNILNEAMYAKKLIQLNCLKTTLPSINGLVQYLEEGYMVICNVNSSILNGKSGYVGHFVIILSVGKTTVTLHDPGLPPLENRKVPTETFHKAWAFPNEKAVNILAIKK